MLRRCVLASLSTGILLLTTGCQKEPTTPPPTPQSKAASAAAEYIGVRVSTNEISQKICRLSFEVTNNTKINFSPSFFIDFKITDPEGNIIEKSSVPGRVPPHGVTIATTSAIISCSQIGSLEFLGFSESTSIDGDIVGFHQEKQAALNAIILKSASDSDGLKVKSKGGPLPTEVANAISPGAMNLLEQAINIETGNSGKWAKMVDEGGVNKFHDYYGLNVKQIEVTWHEGKVKAIFINVDTETPPKLIRRALNKACKTTEEEWKTETGNTIRGDVTKGNLKCNYLTNPGAPFFDLAIDVIQPAAMILPPEKRTP